MLCWLAPPPRRDAEAAEATRLAREEALWRTADRIVLARVTGVSGWREDRKGASYRVVTFRLITAARGTSTPRRIRLRSDDGGDACFGPLGPVYPAEGTLVLFAREGALSDATVLDWSDASRSTHPETLALLKRDSGSRN